MYKKLILTFTLAAGLSALPNAFAAPVAKPKPTTPSAPKQNHVEDSAAVFVAFKNAGTTPAPGPKPIITRPQNHGLDNETVFVAFKNAGTTAGPGPKPNTTKTGGQNQEQDSTIV